MKTSTQTPQVYQSFEEFWPFYLAQHSHPTSRILHIVGTVLGILVFANGVRRGYFTAIFPALFLGYGFSWVGHFFFEKNQPATFTYPKWSLKGDFLMLKMFFMGQLNAELAKHNITYRRRRSKRK